MADYNVKSMGASLDSMCSTADACHGPVRLREGDLYYDSNNPSKIMICLINCRMTPTVNYCKILLFKMFIV